MLKNIGSGWALHATSILTTLLLVPFTLRALGQEQYGLWLAIAAAVGYLGLVQFGVPMASVRHLTQALGKNDKEEARRIATTCIAIYLACGLAVLAIGVPLMFGFTSAYAIPAAQLQDTRWAFACLLLATALGFIGMHPYALMNCYGDFVLKHLILFLSSLVRFALVVGLLWHLPTLSMMGLATLVAVALEMSVFWILVLYRYPEVRPRWHALSRHTASRVFNFGAYVFAMSLATRLAMFSGPLVIGHFLTWHQVPLFSIPVSLITYICAFAGSIDTVVMPLASTLQAQGESAKLRHMFLRSSKIAYALACCAGIFIMVYGPDFLACWVGESFRQTGGDVLRILMLSYFVMLPAQFVSCPLLMGIGQPLVPTAAFSVAGVASLVLGILLMPVFGVEGLAYALAGSNIVLAIFLNVYCCRALHIKLFDYWTTMMPRTIVGLLLCLGAAMAWKQLHPPHTLLDVMIAGAITTSTFAAVWLGLVLRNDEHEVVPPFIKSLGGLRTLASPQVYRP